MATYTRTYNSLPGIDNERTDNCVPIFFGATREYGPNEGWQEVRRKKHAKNKRRRRVARENDEKDNDLITDV